MGWPTPSETLGKCGKVKIIALLFGRFGYCPYIWAINEQRHAMKAPINTQTDTQTGKEYVVIHAWKNGGAVTVYEVIAKREKSMRVRNLDLNMEVTVPYSGLRSMAEVAKEYEGTNNYYPAQWWIGSKDTPNYVHKALGRV